MITLVRAVQTSIACPSQWDAWDADGKYYYLRYRHGDGTVSHYPGGPNFWERLEEKGELVASFEYGDEYAGSIELAEFAQRAGICLAEDIKSRNFNEYLAFHLGTALKETYPEEWAERYGNTEPQL